MTDKLAEEILFRYRLKSSGMTEKDMIEAMQAYHEAKMKEVTDEDIHKIAYNACMHPSMPNGEPEPEHTYYDAFIEGAKAMRDGKIKANG